MEKCAEKKEFGEQYTKWLAEFNSWKLQNQGWCGGGGVREGGGGGVREVRWWGSEGGRGGGGVRKWFEGSRVVVGCRWWNEGDMMMDLQWRPPFS